MFVFGKRLLLDSLLGVFVLGIHSLVFSSWVKVSCWIHPFLFSSSGKGSCWILSLGFLSWEFTPYGFRLGYSLFRVFVLGHVRAPGRLGLSAAGSVVGVGGVGGAGWVVWIGGAGGLGVGGVSRKKEEKLHLGEKTYI